MSGVFGVIFCIRKYIKNFVLSNYFEIFIILCVVGNTAILATNGLVHDEKTLDDIEKANFVFTIIFIVEMLIKILALGLVGYVKDTINIFDGIIVIISIIEISRVG